MKFWTTLAAIAPSVGWLTGNEQYTISVLAMYGLCGLIYYVGEAWT